MSSKNYRNNARKKEGAVRTPLNASGVSTDKSSKRNDAIISKIIAQFTSRTRVEMKSWRDAIAQAENDRYPKREKWAKLIKDLDLDAHWTSQVTLRKLSVLRKAFKVVNKATRDEIPERTRQLQSPWFYELMSTALDAKFYGSQCVEIQDLLEGNLKWNAIYTVPMGHVIPERRQILTKDTDSQGIDYSEDPFVLWFDEDNFLGLLSKATPHLIWIKNAFQSWAEFAEKFGIPMRYATTNKKDATTIDRLEKMLDELGSAARAVFPEGTNIDFKEANTTDAFEVFNVLIKTSSEMISKLVNGVTMLSDNGSSKSQGEVHERAQNKIVDSDAADIQSQMNWYVFPRLKELGYPINPETEEFIFDETEILSKGSLWNIVQGVLKFYTVDEAWLTQEFGIPITGERKIPVKTSGNTNPDVKNFNAARSLPAMNGLIKSAGYVLNKSLSEIRNSATSLFVKAATLFFDNPNNKPEALSQPEWTALFDHVAKNMFGAVEKGYGLSFTDAEGQDLQVLENFRLNLYHFSAFKNYQVLQSLNSLLVDENGAAREKGDFMKLALEANEAYNVNWLDAEYDTALATATSEARMKEFLAEANEFDLLFQTVGDERVRLSHQLLDGIVAAPTDSIVQTLRTPLAIRCRCEWIQIAKGSRAISDTTKIDLPERPKGLSTRRDEVFNESHPYYEGVSNTHKNEIRSFANDQLNKLKK
jgi:hypothetical protein